LPPCPKKLYKFNYFTEIMEKFKKTIFHGIQVAMADAYVPLQV
jgi:hypothetical protein